MKNSTEQLLKTKSNNLASISARSEFHHKPVENTDFINHDYSNLYRTSYTDMSTKVINLFNKQLPKLINTHHVPGYGGFVPGMKSENPFAKTFTTLAKDKINSFDLKRFTGSQFNDYKEYI